MPTAMKKLLFLLLLCSVGVTHLFALSFDDGYLKYTVNTDGTTVTVDGRKSGITASGSLSIPSTVTYNKTVGRNGTSITTNCNYWSSTHSDINNAYCVYFGNNYVGFSNSTNDRSTGNVVRLVNPVNN